MKVDSWRLLKEGEIYKNGDEMCLCIDWKPIPKNWIKQGFVHSHKNDNTMSRQKIPVRRKLK